MSRAFLTLMVRMRSAPIQFRRLLIGCLLTAVSLALGIASALTSGPERAQSANAFVDSVGINIHLHNADTSYSDFPRVQQALQDLRVRHVRDGLIDTSWKPYYDRHNQLGRAGIKATFITSVDQSSPLLVDYPRRMKDSFEAYEAPNEYDRSPDEHWAATLRSFLARLNIAIKSDPAASRFPVIGPSLARSDSRAGLEGLCSFDFANLHNYFAGRNPGTAGWGADGYGSISWNLSNVGAACPGKPVITTETGYQTDAALPQGIPEDVAAKYVPRAFLEQWLHGIQRTYLYELIDLPSGRSAPDSAFGLLRHDYSSKPAYSALKNLLRLLADPGPAFVGQELDFKLMGDLSDVHHLLLQKRTGVFYLALWVEEPSYDVSRKKATPVPVRSIVVQNAGKVRITQHSFDKSGDLRTAVIEPGVRHEVQVSDLVTILEIDSRPVASSARSSTMELRIPVADGALSPELTNEPMFSPLGNTSTR